MEKKFFEHMQKEKKTKQTKNNKKHTHTKNAISTGQESDQDLHCLAITQRHIFRSQLLMYHSEIFFVMDSKIKRN